LISGRIRAGFIHVLHPREAAMNRRTLDIAVPALYVLALLVAVVLQDAGAVGGVAVIGAVLVGVYFAALRQNLKA
jgi:hypothetical protein